MLRDQLLYAKLKVEAVDLDGLTAYVRELTTDGLISLQDKFVDKVEALVWTVIATACDELGNLLFKAEDFALVSGMKFDHVQRLAVAAGKLSQITADDVDDEKKD